MAVPHPADQQRRVYTAEGANRALPLVDAIVRDIVRQWKVVSDLERRLGPLGGRSRAAGPDDPHDEELAHRRTELNAEQDRLRGYLAELEKLGIELKSVESGLCDFPSQRDGREVYLCWKLGEPSVQYWHELDAGAAGRRPLEAVEDLGLSRRTR